jgi:hypothetical protein
MQATEEQSPRYLVIEEAMRRDEAKRDAWVKGRVTNDILVVEGVTLSDVQRWLREALR